MITVLIGDRTKFLVIVKWKFEHGSANLFFIYELIVGCRSCKNCYNYLIFVNVFVIFYLFKINLIKIRYGIENNLVTLATLSDFPRAVDSIDHKALLTECRNMNFSANAIKWVHSYISGQTQAVVCNEEVSKFLSVTSGVPQGSSPGPIFFYPHKFLTKLS